MTSSKAINESFNARENRISMLLDRADNKINQSQENIVENGYSMFEHHNSES